MGGGALRCRCFCFQSHPIALGVSRILYCTPALKRGGAEIHLLRLLRALPSRGPVLAVESNEALRDLLVEAASAGAIAVPADLGWEDRRPPDENAARQHKALALVIGRVRPSIVVTALPWPIYGRGLLTAAAQMSVPSLTIFHLARPDVEVARSDREAVAASLAAGGALVAVSTGIREIVAGLYDLAPSAITVIENGVDLPEEIDAGLRDEIRAQIRRRLGLKPDALVVLTVGRLDPQKGHHDLLAAIGSVLEQIPSARFVWLGEGGERHSLEAALKQRGWLGSIVVMPGQVSDPGPFYRACDAFALPSYFEGFSLALGEAASYGCPIVTTDVSGQGARLPHGRSALLHVPGDVPGLALRLIQILRDRATASRLGQSARAWARGHSNAAMAAEYELVVQRLAAGR